jgi:hypothetical protein
MSDFTSFVEDVRYKVRGLLGVLPAADQSSIAIPSELWNSASSILKYVLDLSSQELEKIRFHAGYMTGSIDMFRFTYSTPSQHDVEQYVTDIGYRHAISDLPERLWIGEPIESYFPHPIGLEWRGRIVNSDVTRYQECIADLWRAGIISSIEGNPDRSTILEIGGGYGGLAHQMSAVLGNYATVLICDLPLMLFYTAVFLAHSNKEKRILFFDGTEPEKLADTERWDIILSPPGQIETVLTTIGCNMVINMISFQEMTETQIREYCTLSQRYGASVLYSVNKERHPRNRDLISLTSLFESCGYVLHPSPDYYDRWFTREDVNGYHTTRTYFVELNADGAARFAIDFIPVHQIRTTPNPVVAYQLKRE